MQEKPGKGVKQKEVSRIKATGASGDKDRKLHPLDVASRRRPVRPE